MTPHAMPKEELLNALQVQAQTGLTDAQAEKRLREAGENRLAEKKKRPTFSGLPSNSRT